jgi:hypothetical protein
MLPASIPIPLPEGLAVPVPKFVRVRQSFDGDEVTDVPAAVAKEFAKFSHIDLKGKRVAVTVGSRGIRSQKPVVVAVVEGLKAAGADPFIVPAMGSHGGGTAEGQQKIVEEYGMGADDLGVPLHSSMEVVELARVADDLAVYCDKNAYEADYIVPLNRVKPHTSFRGKNESGLAKMIAIGLGKHTGAVEMHRRGMERFGELLPIVADAFIEKTNVLFGVAIIENGYEKLKHVEFVAPQDIVVRDQELLEIAKASIPKIHLDEMDVLIVDQIGKDISGAGMDPNVTGRNNCRMNDFDGPEIRQIIITDLTDGTKGNGTGVGVANVTTQRLVGKMNWSKSYVNVVTAGVPQGAGLPLVANTDEEALYIAMRGCPMITAENGRVVRIENTLDLSEIWVSTGLIDKVNAHPKMEVISEPFDLVFDDQGALPSFHPAAPQQAAS